MPLRKKFGSAVHPVLARRSIITDKITTVGVFSPSR